MRYNTEVTAIFKNHHNVQDMTRALFDENGKIKPFYQFKKDALAINKEYNKTWLEAEYNTAHRTARMASKWPEYVRRGGSLEFRSQRDGRVRDTHRLIDGTTYPVGHEFWNIHYPPIAFRCRCFVKWHKDEITKDPEGELPDVPETFKNNPGKTGNVFTKDHPYFTVDGRFKESAAALFGYKPAVDLDKFKNNLSIYEGLKASKDHKIEFVDNMSGGFVFRHIRHGVGELKDNLRAAKRMAAQGDSVILQEVLQNQTNIDALVNGEPWEIKAIQTTSNLGTAFINNIRRSRKQGATKTAIELLKVYDLDKLHEVLKEAFRNDSKKQTETIRLIWQGRIIDVTRKDYEDGRIMDIIKNPGT